MNANLKGDSTTVGSEKAYECESCSYVIFTAEKEEPEWCPICRGKLIEIEEREGERVEHRCADCGLSFSTKKGTAAPYKCAFCNYTFVTTPRKKSAERL